MVSLFVISFSYRHPSSETIGAQVMIWKRVMNIRGTISEVIWRCARNH